MSIIEKDRFDRVAQEVARSRNRAKELEGISPETISNMLKGFNKTIGDFEFLFKQARQDIKLMGATVESIAYFKAILKKICYMKYHLEDDVQKFRNSISEMEKCFWENAKEELK